MFMILLLFHITQHVRSSSIAQVITNKNKIVMTNAKAEPVDCKNLKVTFNVKNDIDKLTGLFTVHHSVCPSKGRCGYENVGALDKDKDEGKKITVQLDSSISPIKSYSGIEIRAYEKDGKIRHRSINWEPGTFGEWCQQLITTATTTIPENTNFTTQIGISIAPRPSATAIIVSVVVLIIFIAIALAIILIKKKKEEDKAQIRGEVMKTEENALYGIYGEENNEDVNQNTMNDHTTAGEEAAKGGLYDEDDYDQMQDQATDRTSQEDDYDKMYN